MEEGDPIAPINGEIESNFAGLETERKKKLCNLIILWGAVSLAIIIIIAIIILLVLSSGKNDGDSNKKGGDEEETIPKDIYGNITCIYDITSGKINILSDDFVKDFSVVIYIGKDRIKYSKKYNFDMVDSKTVRFEIHSKEISLKNMFKGVRYLKNVYFTTNSECKITSMESTFEQCNLLEEFYFEKGWDTSGLTSMKKTFAYCQQLVSIQFYNMSLTNVKDMSFMLMGTSIQLFAPNRFDTKSVETMASMFQNVSKLL